jgi:two-component system, cell cycle response regulator DivK
MESANRKVAERSREEVWLSGRDDAGPSRPARGLVSSKADTRQTDKTTILVIDDERPNLKLAEVVLQSEGFAVKLATDAISALEVLKTCDPALIVMDIQLPGMDGWELTRRLKRNVATSHIPIIALTAYGTKGDEERAQEAGCAAYVAKPVSTRDLPAIIRRHLPLDRT